MRTSMLVCLCLAMPLLGCSDDRGNTEANATESGEGDGDGDPTGDGDGDPTGDGDADTGDGDGDADLPPECESTDQCVLVNDCCTCDVVEAGEEPPCDVTECLLPTCEANGFTPEVACFVGTCVPAPVDCDTSSITCEIVPPPPCEGGLVRSVAGMCYGPCVHPNLCEELPTGCACGEGYACMTHQASSSTRCIPLPPACNGTASCDCMWPWWGELCGGGCSESGGILLCEDGG